MSFQPRAAGCKDIRPSVIVVIVERDSAPICFDDVLFRIDSAVNYGLNEAGFPGYIGKVSEFGWEPGQGGCLRNQFEGVAAGHRMYLVQVITVVERCFVFREPIHKSFQLVCMMER